MCESQQRAGGFVLNRVETHGEERREAFITLRLSQTVRLNDALHLHREVLLQKNGADKNPTMYPKFQPLQSPGRAFMRKMWRTLRAEVHICASAHPRRVFFFFF